MTRVGIVGARNHRALAQVLCRVRELPERTVVVSGGADGVDAVAALAARQRGLAVKEHLPAAAGPLARNTTIATTVDELEAFPWDGCRGTWDTVGKARAVGIPVRIHPAKSGSEEALLVFSAQRRYAGRGALCVMRFGGGDEGAPFAPTEQLLGRVLAARAQAEQMRALVGSMYSGQLLLGESPDARAERERRALEMRERADAIEAAAWDYYKPRFKAEMRVSYGLARGTPAWTRRPPDERALLDEAWERGARPRPEAWRKLLARGFVVITCGCSDEARCHRGILRSEILPALGAVDGGEVSA